MLEKDYRAYGDLTLYSGDTSLTFSPVVSGWRTENTYWRNSDHVPDWPFLQYGRTMAQAAIWSPKRVTFLLIVVGAVLSVSCGSEWKYKRDLFEQFEQGNAGEYIKTAEIKPDSINLELLDWAIFKETNYQRERLGLGDLRYNFRLHEAARLHSEEMVQLRYFDHVSPNPTNKTIKKRLQHVGIRNGFGGENIAIHPITRRLSIVFNPAQVEIVAHRYVWRNQGVPYTYHEFAAALVERWMDSPPHRENILSPYFKYLGVGCVESEFRHLNTLYVTQNFSSTNF